MVPLIRTYGAAVVVGCIDEDSSRAMAVTGSASWRRGGTHGMLTGKYGVPERDPHLRSARLSGGYGDLTTWAPRSRPSRGVRAITRFPKKLQDHSRHLERLLRLPRGPRGAQRGLLSSAPRPASLRHVNSERLERYASIPEEERGSPRTSSTGGARTRWRRRRPLPRPDRPEGHGVPLHRREAGLYIVEGSRRACWTIWTLKLEEMGALDIINGPLMKGMGEAGASSRTPAQSWPRCSSPRKP